MPKLPPTPTQELHEELARQRKISALLAAALRHGVPPKAILLHETSALRDILAKYAEVKPPSDTTWEQLKELVRR